MLINANIKAGKNTFSKIPDILKKEGYENPVVLVDKNLFDNSEYVSKVIQTIVKESMLLFYDYPFEPSYKHYFLGFVFFRLFDIWKPIPINYYEKKYENAFGIIFDDIIAAFYALIAISIIDYLYAYF